MTADSDRGVAARTSQPAETDFLSSLLDRALARAPVLERRRPAFFEPPRPAMPLGEMLLEQTIEEKALPQDSPAETSERSPAVVSSPAAPSAHTESIHPDTRPSQPARSDAPMLTETERKEELNSDRVSQSSPVDNRFTSSAREENTAPSARRPESSSAQDLPAAPLLVSETIIERQVEIRVPDFIREHQPAERDRPTPGRPLPSAPPVTTALLPPGLRPVTVAAHPLNRERDYKETARSPTLDRPEPRMPIESIRDKTKEPVAIATPQPSITQRGSPVTQLQPIAEKKSVAPAQKIEPRIRLEAKPAKPETAPPITGQRFPASAATPSGLQQTAPVEPTIQVTIGRVEVRATLPASPPRVARPAAPKLSLEEYLKSRSGGAK